MKEIDKVEKEIKKVEEEINDYIHSISDIKVPTNKEFDKKKKIVTAKVISSKYFTGISTSTDIVYDVIFEYVIDNIIYKSRMQTLNKYSVGDILDIYYYKKDPNYIKEINDYKQSSEFGLTKVLIFIILFIISSILFVTFYY